MEEFDLFDSPEEAAEECLFCGELFCDCLTEAIKPADIASNHWAAKLNTGTPVFVDELKGRKNVWCVTVSNDWVGKTIVCFDKNSGRHQDVSWDRLTPTEGFKAKHNI